MQEKSRLAHIQRDHQRLPAAIEKTCICEFCAKPFRTKYELRLHINTVHSTSDEQFQCDVCHNWFKNKRSLLAHLRRHSEKPQKCEYCGKQYSRLAALQYHIERMHQITLKCYMCAEVFKTAKELDVSPI